MATKWTDAQKKGYETLMKRLVVGWGVNEKVASYVATGSENPAESGVVAGKAYTALCQLHDVLKTLTARNDQSVLEAFAAGVNKAFAPRLEAQGAVSNLWDSEGFIRLPYLSDGTTHGDHSPLEGERADVIGGGNDPDPNGTEGDESPDSAETETESGANNPPELGDDSDGAGAGETETDEQEQAETKTGETDVNEPYENESESPQSPPFASGNAGMGAGSTEAPVSVTTKAVINGFSLLITARTGAAAEEIAAVIGELLEGLRVVGREESIKSLGAVQDGRDTIVWMKGEVSAPAAPKAPAQAPALPPGAPRPPLGGGNKADTARPPFRPAPQAPASAPAQAATPETKTEPFNRIVATLETKPGSAAAPVLDFYAPNLKFPVLRVRSARDMEILASATGWDLSQFEPGQTYEVAGVLQLSRGKPKPNNPGSFYYDLQSVTVS